MKNNDILVVMAGNAIAWITTGVIAWAAITTTQNAWWALLLLIPALCGSEEDYGEDYKWISEHNNGELIRCPNCEKRFTEECGLRLTYMPREDTFYCAAGEKKKEEE